MPESLSIKHYCPVRRIGSGSGHHFFGYYNKHPWDRTGRYLLGQRVEMMTGDLTGKEIAEIGYFDLEERDNFQVVGETTSWNWQMGSQLQWLPGKPGRQLIFNSRTSSEIDSPYHDFCSTVYDMDSGETRELPLPIYVVAPNSEYALCVDYSRFQVTHPTIGYIASGVEPELENAPEEDGIYRIQIGTGEFELILSLHDLSRFQPVESMNRAIHWVTHLEINPASSRFLFIHRWTERVEDETCFLHRLFTMNPDGTDLRLLECTNHPLPQLQISFDPGAVGTFDYEKSEFQISHPAWKNDEQVIAWGPHLGNIHYHLYDDQTVRAIVIGENCLTENGHMTYSSDGQWLLSDTYPDDLSNERLLILYHPETDRRYDVGSFYTSPRLGKLNRCDLHPRWHPSTQTVCIDSVHEHQRQMYLVDVSSLTRQ
jgi:hypothetical protein